MAFTSTYSSSSIRGWEARKIGLQSSHTTVSEAVHVDNNFYGMAVSDDEQRIISGHYILSFDGTKWVIEHELSFKTLLNWKNPSAAVDMRFDNAQTDAYWKLAVSYAQFNKSADMAVVCLANQPFQEVHGWSTVPSTNPQGQLDRIDRTSSSTIGYQQSYQNMIYFDNSIDSFSKKSVLTQSEWFAKSKTNSIGVRQFSGFGYVLVLKRSGSTWSLDTIYRSPKSVIYDRSTDPQTTAYLISDKDASGNYKFDGAGASMSLSTNSTIDNYSLLVGTNNGDVYRICVENSNKTITSLSQPVSNPDKSYGWSVKTNSTGDKFFISCPMSNGFYTINGKTSTAQGFTSSNTTAVLGTTMELSRDDSVLVAGSVSKTSGVMLLYSVITGTPALKHTIKPPTEGMYSTGTGWDPNFGYWIKLNYDGSIIITRGWTTTRAGMTRTSVTTTYKFILNNNKFILDLPNDVCLYPEYNFDTRIRGSNSYYTNSDATTMYYKDDITGYSFYIYDIF
jgi:hypothetical protein